MLDLFPSQTSKDPDIQAVMRQMYEFERRGERVFIEGDDSRREQRMRAHKYATLFDDGKAMSLRSADCNVHYLPLPLRPAYNGMAFQKNSAYRGLFSDA